MQWQYSGESQIKKWDENVSFNLWFFLPLIPQVCQSGECSGSICSKFGMKECFLTSNVIDDKRKLCELACQIGNDNTTCKGTSELSSITKLPIGISLRPGSPCDNYQVDNKRKSQTNFLTVPPYNGPLLSTSRATVMSFSSAVPWMPKVLWLVWRTCSSIEKRYSP